MKLVKKTYLPQAANDTIFTFVGGFSAIAYSTAFVVVIALIVFIVFKKRKDGRK